MRACEHQRINGGHIARCLAAQRAGPGLRGGAQFVWTVLITLLILALATVFGLALGHFSYFLFLFFFSDSRGRIVFSFLSLMGNLTPAVLLRQHVPRKDPQ